MWFFFIKHPRFAYLALIALLAIGIFALLAIPRESAPEVVIPVGVVQTILPGASAADVETLITNELERPLSNLSGVDTISSVSSEGLSLITITFNASANVDKSIADLKDEIDKVKPQLPTDAEDPIVTQVDYNDQPILTVAISANKTTAEFSVLADELEDALLRIPGISRVAFGGVAAKEVTVMAKSDALAHYNLTVLDLVSAIKSANTSFPIGKIENNGIQYNIAFAGDIASLSEIQNIVVATIAEQPIFIRDVATVTNGLAPAQTITRASNSGTPSRSAITLDVYKQSGSDITRITPQIHTLLQQMRTNGPLADAEFSVVQDSGQLIKDDLSKLGLSGLQTVALVMILLIVAIGWREGIIAGLAIPLSFLFGFIGLYFSGNTINFLSLFALILGIGILVDSAIVMVEGINRKLKDDPTIDKTSAAMAAIVEFRAPLISGTLTTVAMFAGLFIVSGVIGEFIASIPFTLIFVLFASLFVSLTFIPLFAAHWLHRRNTTGFEEKQVRYAHALEQRYVSLLDKVLGSERNERRFLWSIRVALLIAILLPVLGVVKVVFFDSSNADYVVVSIETTQGTSKEVTDLTTRQVEDMLYDYSDIASFVTTVGSGNQYLSGGTGEKYANIFVNLASNRELTSQEIIDALRPQLNNISTAHVTVAQLSDGPPSGAAVSLAFSGNDLRELTIVAEQAKQLIEGEVPHVVNVATSANNNATEFVLELDRTKAAMYGVAPATISQLIRTAVYGAEASSFATLTDDIPIVVKMDVNLSNAIDTESSDKATIDDIERLLIPSTKGYIPVSAVAQVYLREARTAIPHKDGERVVTVTADITDKGNARDAQAAAVALMENSLSMPAGITLSTGDGETETSNKAFTEMFIALIVGLLLMIAILVLQFNSYLHTRYVLSILPYSLIGIMTGLALTGNALSFPSLMGFIALSGIVVNNSILLIDVMNHLRRQAPNRNVREIVIEAASTRLRPILLTTLTTVTGMVPLIFAGDMWAPLAYAVMFGLVFSVVITLIHVPIIYHRHPGKLGKE